MSVLQEICRENDGKGSFSPASFGRGVRKALPIVLGYLPVAFAFGVMASQAGMSVLEAGLMGFCVFAGSGQLIATGMLLAGAGAVSIVVTTFVVNLRHLLMSAAMSPYLRRWSKKLQAVFAWEMTDETFAMNIARFSEQGVDRDEAFGIHATAHLAWISGGVLGAIFGDIIGDVRPYGLDYALAGMFVALLTPHLRVRARILPIFISAALAVGLALSPLAQWNVIAATAIASTVGVFIIAPGGPARHEQSGGEA